MLQQRIFPLVLILTLLSLLSAGCSSTKLISSWSDPNFAGQPLQKVLIVGVNKDEVNRRAYETHFAERLEQEGITGVPAHQVIADANKYSEDNIRAAVKEVGADAAIISQLVSVEEKERYVPPTYEYEPAFGFGHGFYGYYGMSHRYVSTPGYYTTDTIVKLEAVVFSTQTEDMIWAGATSSFNPSSAEKVIKENTDIIIKDMKESGLL